MKKIFIAVINFLAAVLCIDINNIYNLYRCTDGAGIGINIIFGIIEINDKVPYKNVPVYLAALAAAVATVTGYDIYSICKRKTE